MVRTGRYAGRRPRKEVLKELEEARARLSAYLAKEAELLGSGAARSYQIGSRRLERYDLSLKDLRGMIDALERRVAELEAELRGGGPRRAVAVVPRDW